MEESDIDSILLEFRVSKTWMNTYNFTTGDIKFYRYHDGAWIKETVVLSKDTADYFYYDTVLSDFSEFAIMGQKDTAFGITDGKISFSALLGKIMDYYLGRLSFFELLTLIIQYYS